jgi:phage gpG-like protein
MSVEFVLNVEDRKRIQKMLSGETAAQIGRIMFKTFQQLGAKMEGDLKDNIRGVILKVRSSRLLNSIGSRAEVDGDQITATIGSGARRDEPPVPYASIHETGGTIRPKKGMYLTIPSEAARTKGGDTKAGYTATNLRLGLIPGYKGSVIIGKTIYGILEGRKNKLRAMFFLVKSVDIPARRYLSKTLEAREKQIPNLVVESVVRKLREAANG